MRYTIGCRWFVNQCHNSVVSGRQLLGRCSTSKSSWEDRSIFHTPTTSVSSLLILDDKLKADNPADGLTTYIRPYHTIILLHHARSRNGAHCRKPAVAADLLDLAQDYGGDT